MIGIQPDKYGYAEVLSEMRAVTARAAELKAAAERYNIKLNELVYAKLKIEYNMIAEDAAAVFYKSEFVKQRDELTADQREIIGGEFARMMLNIVEISQKL